jgi:hypothetical protein
MNRLNFFFKHSTQIKKKIEIPRKTEQENVNRKRQTAMKAAATRSNGCFDSMCDDVGRCGVCTEHGANMYLLGPQMSRCLCTSLSLSPA